MSSKAICILGMHRSGTSTITRALNLLGVYLGVEKDLVPPYPENPEGFWERLDIIRIQERLLAAQKRTWDTIMPLPEEWHVASEVQSFRDELVALLKQNFSGDPLWGWKEPRSMLLINLWINILDELEIELDVVFVVRNPLDVARSLQKRNGFPLDKSFGIWFNYNITALRAISNIPTVFLSYDKFLTNWEPELRRCAHDLSIEWPQKDTDLKERIHSFIRPDLRHSCSSMEDLHNMGAPQPVLKLYELLLSLLDGDASIDSVRGTVNDLYRDFSANSRFYQHDMLTSWDIGRRLLATNKNLAENDPQLAVSIRQLAECSYLRRLKFTKLLKKVLCAIKIIIRLPALTNSSDSISEEHFNKILYNIVAGRILREDYVSRFKTVDIIIPVFNAIEITEACISSVLKYSDNCRLILVNDASSEPRVKEYLNSVHSLPQKNIEVIVRHNEVNVGFLKTINDAYKLTKGHFVILNSDTEVPPDWLNRLFAPIIANPSGVASATPFSNSAMGWLGCNFPNPEQDNELFKQMDVDLLDSFFHKYSTDTPIELFSGVGFCMAFNRTVVEKIGLFDSDTFGKGYCEEVDWSLRAFTAGYKNVLVPNLFVFHKYGASFDPKEKQNLQESNFKKLLNIHATQMDRLKSINSKVASQSIRDAIAIIADAHTKGGDRWMAVIGGEKSSWGSIKEELVNSGNSDESKGVIFIEFVSFEQGLKLHILTPIQERIIYLPHEACNKINQILSFLCVDIAVIVENAPWPDSINIIGSIPQIKVVGQKC